jgi:hypothetical protein
MKPTMMFTIIAITTIILMVVFDISLAPNAKEIIASNIPSDVLFVCPVDKSAWTSLANTLVSFKKPIKFAFFFALMILISVWSWALYQNLLKDKFDRGSFKSPWGYTKALFWAAVIMFMLMKTPTYFRFVQVDGLKGNWVLCDANSKGAQMKKIEKIHD